MKNQINTIFAAMMCMLFVGVTQVQAQVTPMTSGVALFCNSPGDYDLGSAADANTGGGAGATWRVVHSPTQLNDAEVVASSPIGLTDGTHIPEAKIQTGYLYISQTYSDACDSEIKEIPVYVFKQLTSSITAADYCIEDVASQAFTATPSSTDTYNTFAYQWYTVSSGTETVIAGATSPTYQPSTTLGAGNTTTYRVKVAYLVDTKKYCTAQIEKAVAVKAKPTVSITIEGVADNW